MRGRRRPFVAVRLFGRGFAYRRGTSALIVILAVVGCAVAAVAPAYRSAAAVSALRSRMVGAPADASGVQVAAASWPDGSPDAALARATSRLPLSVAAIRGLAVGGQSNDTGRIVVHNATQLAVPGGPPEYSTLVWRQGECGHVVFRSGRCPAAADEIALPVNAAADLKAQVGSPIVASNLDRPYFGLPPEIGRKVAHKRALGALAAKSLTLPLKVVGVFQVPAGQSSYWFGQDVAAPPLNGGGSQIRTVTALVPRRTLTRLPLPYQANVTIDQPLDWSHATVADQVAVERALIRLRAGALVGSSVLTGIPALLHADAVDRSQLNRLVVLAQIQLLLLVGLVLIAVLAATIEQRRPELVTATLRGRRPSATAVSVAVEPVTLLLLGLVPGLALAVPLARLGAHLWLRPGTPVHLTGASVIGALAVTAFAAVAALIVGWRAASRPLPDQLAAAPGSARGRGWLEIIAVTLAVAGVTELLSSASSSTPWSLLAPSLTGLAAGLLLGRLAPRLLRPSVRATAESPRLGVFLAIRELSRDRNAWRATAVVTLAMSLLAFSAVVDRADSRDRLDRAGLTVGAPTVVTVTSPPGHSLLDAVDRADPAGDWAMAAELLVPFGSPAQRLLAVDTQRLPRVAGWTRRIDGYTPTGLETLLHVPPGTAHHGLPVLTAGPVEGTTLGLNNEPLIGSRVFPTDILPVLLGQGAFADLRSVMSVAPPVAPAELGSTSLTEQVWLGSHAPSDALARLRAAGLTVTTVNRRSRIAQGLQRQATTAGLSAFAAVSVIAAILAIALLLGTTIAGSAQQRTETLAFGLAGVPRSSVIRSHVAAVAARLTLAAAVGFGCGLATLHLSAHLIPRAAPGSLPPPSLPLAWFPAFAAVAITTIPVLLAEMGIAAHTAKRADASRLRTAAP